MPTDKEYLLEYVRRDSYRTMRFLGGFSHVPLHAKWHREFNSTNRIAKKAPIGHAKTTNFLYHIAWKIGIKYFNPYLFIGLMTSSMDNSRFRVNMTADIIMSRQYKELFDWVIPDKKSFNSGFLDFIRPHTIQKDPVLHGLGFESKWTGDRFTDLYCDDVVDFESAISIPICNYQIQKFKTDLLNRMMPGGWLGYIYTPFTEWDLSHEIEDKCILPVTSDDYRNYEVDGKLLWEDMWTKEAIESKKINEPDAWKQGFLLIPLASEMMRVFFREDFFFVDGQNVSNQRPNLALDFATGSGGDNSSYAILYDFKDFKYFHDIQTMNVKVDRFFEIVERLDYKYNFGTIWFESNATQKSFGDLMPKSFKYKAKETFTTKAKKDSVNTGLGAMSSQIRNRKIIFNKTIPDSVIIEFISYPFASKKDAVMSSWMAWENQCNKKEYFFV